MARTLIMTDSTCDLPTAWVKQFDIRIVPTYVHFGLESLADDGVELNRADFYRRLLTNSHYPTTSAPPLGQTIEVMARALQDAEHVIAITAPAVLSGIYNIFRLAIEHTAPDRVTLIDGQMLSMGLGWQVLMAAEMARAGAAPADIQARVLNMRPRTDVWAALDTMESLRRSGRVGWAAAAVGELFRIKPVIRLHAGVVSSVARVRTSQRAFDKLVELARQAAPFERMAILHTDNPDGARQLGDALRDIHPSTPLATVDVTPVIGVHVGPHGLGLAVVRQQATG